MEAAGANGWKFELTWFWKMMYVGRDESWALSIMCLGKLMMDVRFVDDSGVTALI
jgi:hypothetical protein